MRKMMLNLAALAVVATGGLYVATPASAEPTFSSQASCTQNGIRLEGSKCAIVNGNCACSG